MKTAKRLFAYITLLITTISSFAQDQQQEKQKTPVEIAAEQTDRFQKDLGLNDAQAFLVDSVLQTNLTGVYTDFERMKAGGVQSSESYRAVQEMWMKKTEDAFRKILTPDQFLRYEKMTGLYAKRKKQEKKKAKLK
ncbi:MAG: hypothetical protein ABFC28_02935 [Rikenellaceae bacterium]